MIIAKLGHPQQNSYVTVDTANKYFDNRRDIDEWDTLNSTEKEEVLIQATKDIDMYNFIGEKYYDSQNLSFPRRVRAVWLGTESHEIVTGNCGTPITINSFRNGRLWSNVYGKYPTSYWKYGTVHITSGTAVRSVVNIASSNVTNGSITTDENFSEVPGRSSAFIVFAPIDDKIARAQLEQALYILKNADIETLTNLKELGVKRVEIGRARVDFKDGALGRIAVSPESRKLLSKWIRTQVRIGRA